MPPTHRLFRRIGLLAIAVAATPGLLGQWFAGPQAAAQTLADVTGVDAMTPALAFPFVLCAHVLGVVAFTSMFWVLTRPDVRPAPRQALLITAQFVVGLLTDPDLLLVVAAELPFALPLRAALAWLIAQCSAVALASGIAASQLTFELSATIGSRGPAVASSALPPAEIMFGVGVLTSVAWQIFSFCMGYIAVSERQARLRLVASHAELLGTQNLLASSVRASERLRIARDLHDAMGHHLTALSLHLDLAVRLAGGKAAEPLHVAQGLARRLLGEVRTAVGIERSPQRVELREALRLLCEGFPERRIALSISEDFDLNDTAMAHTLFRSVQEAISNAVHHGNARDIRIDLRNRDDCLEVQIRDDGKGTNAVQPGNGLRGIRERVEEHGGTLHIESAARCGFTIRIALPGAARAPAPR